MTTQEISEEQKATRRRALGRHLIKEADNLFITLSLVKDSSDLQHLTDKEKTFVEKLLKGLVTVHTNFIKFGQQLEKSE